MAIIMDGRALSEKIRAGIKQETALFYQKNGFVPGLAVVIAGEDPASKIYVRNKKLACEEVGFYSEEHALPEQTTETELLSLIHRLNEKKEIHGILVQFPLPASLAGTPVVDQISAEKDVDAFHPVNVGKITLGKYDFAPCTPAGVMELLAEYGISPDGKQCVVVGRSNIVGKPQSLLLLHANGTVTVCHSRTKNLAEVTKRADILVLAVGRAEFLTGDMIKEGAVVIDVGMNRNAQNKLCGDAHFASCAEKASHITPVPGGVGPMTITMLLKNTLTAAKLKATR